MVQERWDRLIGTIREVAKNSGMIRNSKAAGKGKRWQDREIRQQKSNTWKALNKWLKSKKDEDREKLKEERGRLKDIIKKKKEEEREKRWEEVQNSKGMNEFWKAINKFRTRRKKRGGKIGKKAWDRHFRELLGAREGEVREGGDISGLEDEQDGGKRN